MTISVVISMAGLDDSLERRLFLAARLLGASRISATVKPWNGTRSDILVVDVNDAYGLTAYALAKRRGDVTLPISRVAGLLDDGSSPLSRNCQVIELQSRLRDLALRSTSKAAQELVVVPAGRTAEPVGGLLGWLTSSAYSGDLVATIGTHSVLVRKSAARIVGRSHSDLVAARSNFLDPTWTARAVQRDDLANPETFVSHSLDAFLIDACQANERTLPWLHGRHKLAHWPDLGTLSDNAGAMMLSALMSHSEISVDELALRCDVDKVRINAFCWAVSAAGLLELNPRNSVTPMRAAVAPVTNRSVVARLARHFGLRFGMENSRV